MNAKLLLFGSFFIAAIIANNVACSLSITKPKGSPELLEYTKGSEFIKLSYKQFVTLTGQKPNFWKRLSFTILHESKL